MVPDGAGAGSAGFGAVVDVPRVIVPDGAGAGAGSAVVVPPRVIVPSVGAGAGSRVIVPSVGAGAGSRLIVEAGKMPPEMQTEEILQCGRLVLRPRVSRAYWNNVDVNLTLTEFNIVRLLASSVGDYVTYRAVYDCMHHVGFIAGSGEDGYRTNVRSSIKRIRNKFRAIDDSFAGIENFPSFGYRWGGADGPAA